MAVIAATCATIVAALASASGGSTIKLSGDCPAIAISRSYRPILTVDADGATVRGLTIQGSGIAWKGGTIRAAAGMDAKGKPGYGALVRGSNLSIVGVTFTDANRGMVIDQAADIKVQSSKFVALRTDGIIASNSRNLEITRNEFSGSLPRATTCTRPDDVVRGLSKRVCTERGGHWQDGDHPDAIQLRDAIIGALIGWNRIEGETQAIGQMDAPTDRPLADIKIVGNHIRATSGHSITLTNCEGCSIIDNDVARVGPGKTVLRFKPEMTKACGNRVADGGPGRERCPR
jgi:nitrous oxidase accessory protein NosD